MATLNIDLKRALNSNITNNTVIANITNPPGAVGIGPTRSIHVPRYKDNAGAYTLDSCITITTLLNQWDVYTRDHTAGAGGILSGYDILGAGPQDMAPYLFITIFGGIDEALHFFNAAVAAAAAPPLAPLAAYFAAMVVTLTAIRAVQNPPPAPYVAPLAIVPPALQVTDGWSFVLNYIASVRPDAEKTTGANEIYEPPVGGAVPVINAAARVCIPPSDLIRYAFGLLWRIKIVLGDNWPDTHRQMTTGGKKSSRFTHRKKQYSQRRYKK